jgi:hypothetical protein
MSTTYTDRECVSESRVNGSDFDVADWLDHTASLKRAFTPYAPRHRADGPAL